jgi:hypothetical protein
MMATLRLVGIYRLKTPDALMLLRYYIWPQTHPWTPFVAIAAGHASHARPRQHSAEDLAIFEISIAWSQIRNELDLGIN